MTFMSDIAVAVAAADVAVDVDVDFAQTLSVTAVNSCC